MRVEADRVYRSTLDWTETGLGLTETLDQGIFIETACVPQWSGKCLSATDEAN